MKCMHVYCKCLTTADRSLVTVKSYYHQVPCSEDRAAPKSRDTSPVYNVRRFRETVSPHNKPLLTTCQNWFRTQNTRSPLSHWNR